MIQNTDNQSNLTEQSENSLNFEANNQTENNREINLDNLRENQNNQKEMADLDFVAKLGQVVKKQYSGDPQNLKSFIESVDLANLRCTEAQKPPLVLFIKSRLEGKAGEVIADDDDTMDKIKAKHQAKIKPEKNEVVVGRLLAL